MGDPDTLVRNGNKTETVAALQDSERALLSSLGIGVLATWKHLPRDIQKLIFVAATHADPGDTGRLKSDIALFLHEHGHAGDGK